MAIGLENPTFFWPKVTFLFLNVPKGGGGGSTSLGIIPKKNSFFTASLVQNIQCKKSIKKPRCEQQRDSTWQTQTCVSMMEVTRLRKKMDGMKRRGLGTWVFHWPRCFISSHLNDFTEYYCAPAWWKSRGLERRWRERKQRSQKLRNLDFFTLTKMFYF